MTVPIQLGTQSGTLDSTITIKYIDAGSKKEFKAIREFYINNAGLKQEHFLGYRGVFEITFGSYENANNLNILQDVYSAINTKRQVNTITPAFEFILHSDVGQTYECNLISDISPEKIGDVITSGEIITLRFETRNILTKIPIVTQLNINISGTGFGRKFGRHFGR